MYANSGVVCVSDPGPVPVLVPRAAVLRRGPGAGDPGPDLLRRRHPAAHVPGGRELSHPDSVPGAPGHLHAADPPQSGRDARRHEAGVPVRHPLRADTPQLHHIPGLCCGPATPGREFRGTRSPVTTTKDVHADLLQHPLQGLKERGLLYKLYRDIHGCDVLFIILIYFFNV